MVTTSVITDTHTGALNAKPMPRRNTAANTITGLRRCSVPKTASPAAAIESQTCIMDKSFLRSAMSASAPAGKVKRKKGNDAAVDNSDSKKGDGDSVFITQVAAMS